MRLDRSLLSPLCVLLAFSSPIAEAATTPAKIVISQIYGGGGNSGAPYNRDYVELFNSGGAAASLSGWSIQYGSATGTSWQVAGFGSNVIIQPGQYVLVGLGSGANGVALPTPDVSGTIAMSSSAGKVALVNSTTALSGSCPSSAAIMDLVGFGGSANCSEGGVPTVAPSNTLAILRAVGGCTDTNNNGADFATAAPAPRNSASATDVCASSGLPTNIKATGGAAPSSALVGEKVLLTAAVQPGLNPTSSSVSVVANLSAIGGSPSQILIDDGMNGDAIADDNIFSRSVIVATGTALGGKAMPVAITDAQGRSASATINLNIISSLNPISQIQGTGRASPYANGTIVVTEGIVTAVKYNGFFLQTADNETDGNAASSEGIFVYTKSIMPAIGSRIRLTGTVSEYTPSDDPNQLPTTELTNPSYSVISSGNTLPAAVQLTEADANAATSVDWLERYEGMRVKVSGLKVVGPVRGYIDEPNATSSANGIFAAVLPSIARPFREEGIGALDAITLPTGVTPPVFDTNPERLRVDSAGQTGASMLSVDVDDSIGGFSGVLDYAEATYTLLPDVGANPSVIPGAVMTTVPSAAGDEFTIGGFNLFHFYDTTDDQSTSDVVLTDVAFNNRLMKTSNAICAFTHNPDILGVVEVENVATLQKLADAVNAQAGNALFPNSCSENPEYVAYLLEGNDSGGIDIGFLLKTAKVSTGVPRVEMLSVTQIGKDAKYTNPNGTESILNDRPSLVLEARIHHANGASADVTVIANHLRSLIDINSTAASSNGWATEGERVRAKRAAQAAYLADYVQSRQQANPNERIVLLGDFNAYEFNDGYVDSMGIITGREAGPSEVLNYVDSSIVVPLTNMADLTEAADRYSFSYGGNAQSLDHMVVNQAVVDSALSIRSAHPRLNSDFGVDNFGDYTVPVRVSDHDPVVLYVGEAGFHTSDLSAQVKANKTTVLPGQKANFTVTAGNADGDEANGVELVLSINGVSPASMSVTSPAGWICGAPSAETSGFVLVHCSPGASGKLDSGSSGNFGVAIATTRTQSGQVLTLGAAISALSVDPNADNNSGSAQVTLRGRQTVNPRPAPISMR